MSCSSNRQMRSPLRPCLSVALTAKALAMSAQKSSLNSHTQSGNQSPGNAGTGGGDSDGVTGGGDSDGGGGVDYVAASGGGDSADGAATAGGGAASAGGGGGGGGGENPADGNFGGDDNQLDDNNDNQPDANENGDNEQSEDSKSEGGNQPDENESAAGKRASGSRQSSDKKKKDKVDAASKQKIAGQKRKIKKKVTTTTTRAPQLRWDKTALDQPYPQASQHWEGVLTNRMTPPQLRFKAIAAESMAAVERALTSAQDAHAIVTNMRACFGGRRECDTGERAFTPETALFPSTNRARWLCFDSIAGAGACAGAAERGPGHATLRGHGAVDAQSHVRDQHSRTAHS